MAVLQAAGGASADNARVLYLALDACDPDTMRRLVAAGRCPNIAGLLAESATVDTVGPYGTAVGSTWMTIATSRHVERHRYFNWIEVDPATYELRSTTPYDAQGTPFWVQLSDQGQRVGIFDVPHSQPPDALNGVLITEWGCDVRHHGTRSHPAELIEELEARTGGHPYGTMDPPGADSQFTPCDWTRRAGARRTIDEDRQLRDLMLEGLAAKERASVRLLASGGWGVFATVIGETHGVGHQLWHLHDPTHPRHDPAARAVIGDPVEQVYERADALVGAHVHAAGPGATVFIHLSHGMRAHHDGDHLLDEVLRRIEVAYDAEARAGWRTRLARRALDRAPARGRAALQRSVAAAVRRRIDAAPPAVSEPPGASADRRWYQVPNNTAVGAVRFNVIGREGQGLVHRDEIPRLTEELRAALLEVVNVDSGRPAARRVVPSDEVLERTPDDPFPDVFVEWDRDGPIERVWSPRIGTVVAPYDHWRTGHHHDRGLLIVHGPGVTPGHRAEPMDLEDIAPTFSAVVGVELADVDGVVRHDVLGASPTTARLPPVEHADATARRRSRRRLRPAPATSALELAADAARRGDLAVRAERAARDLEEQVARLREATEALERTNLVWTTMRWLEGTVVEEDRLVSVITPTRNRPELLAQAIRSVLAQTYGRWEMVVVDDGGHDAKSVVADIGDDRVRAVEVSHRGASAARNVGLDLATGDVVTYLDDDNELDPGWLKALVWGFQTHPEAEVLYGARLIDDKERVLERPAGGWPWVQFNRFDRGSLRVGNLADIGVMAHVRGLPEARFDEQLSVLGDWDQLLALTEHRVPLELPAIALRYYTDGLDRLTGQNLAEFDVVREKWADDAPWP